MKPVESVQHCDQVAVYGTLRRGFGNHMLLSRSNTPFVGKVRQKLPFVMYSLGGFPVLVDADQEHYVTLEVYQVDGDGMSSLDRLEGYPNFYNRRVITTALGDAWVYFMRSTPGHKNMVVHSGDWHDYTQNRGIENDW